MGGLKLEYVRRVYLAEPVHALWQLKVKAVFGPMLGYVL